jgi:aminomethyltransferase
MTLANNPYEVGLGWLVDDKAEDYIGKAALQRIKAQGVSRKLVGVEIGGDPISFNMTRWPVAHDGRQVGFITSAIYSPRLKKNLGYANVPVELSRLGSELTVAVPGVGDRSATVVRKPFVDPDKDIPKS